MSNKPNQGLFAPGTGKCDRLTFSDNGAAESISDHEALILGQEVTRKVLCDGKVKPITILAILWPFLVNVEIGLTRLHFHHHDLAFWVDGGDVSASTIGE